MQKTIQRIFAYFWRVDARRMLALCFLAFVFVVSAATFPKCVTQIGDSLQAQHFTFKDVTVPIDTLYRKMLDFHSPTLINKGSYINLNGLVARLMGQRYVNERVKLDNGHLSILCDPADVTKPCQQITELYRRQTAAGKAFLFVLAPSQVPVGRDILPAGYVDYSNQNGDALLKGLSENSVPVMDMRAEMIADGLSWDDAMFTTDHHWKTETGFWAFGKILAKLAENKVIRPVAAQYTDPANYRVETYKDWFLGYSGTRTGRYYAGVDDFSVITPKFDTQMTVKLLPDGVRQQGTFAQAAIDLKWVQSKDYFNDDTYRLYGDDPWETVYRNAQAPMTQKVLVVGDSFTNAVSPYLSLTFQSMLDMDTRSCKGSFSQVFGEYQPDITVVMLYPATLRYYDTGNACTFFTDDELRGA